MASLGGLIRPRPDYQNMPGAYLTPQTQSKIYVARCWECIDEVGGKCRKFRESVYVRGPQIDIEAEFGRKIRQCVQVYRNKMPVGQICSEGQVFLNNFLLDGKYADLLKAAVEQLEEGWHSLDEAPVITLLNVVRMIEEELGK